MNLKENVVRHLGLLGQMTPVKDITPGRTHGGLGTCRCR
jgi:hypothetical protein